MFAFKLRFIGNPSERIHEDPTRIIRGIRIAHKMNFTIDEETQNSFVENKDELNRVSKSKLNREIIKFIDEYGEEKVDAILKEYGIVVEKENENGIK